jgi:hypothetical protein
MLDVLTLDPLDHIVRDIVRFQITASVIAHRRGTSRGSAVSTRSDARQCASARYNLTMPATPTESHATPGMLQAVTLRYLPASFAAQRAQQGWAALNVSGGLANTRGWPDENRHRSRAWVGRPRIPGGRGGNGPQKHVWGARTAPLRAGSWDDGDPGVADGLSLVGASFGPGCRWPVA